MRLLLIFATGVLIGALCVTLGFFLGQTTTAVEPSRPAPVVLAPWPSATPRETASPLVPDKAGVAPSRHRIPSEPPGADQAGSPAPTVTPTRVSGTGIVSGSAAVRGIASWYTVGSGLYAAAGPLLRVGDWRGRTVTVSAGGASVTVRLIDFCQCGDRPGGPTVIDLSRDAFARLAPPSQGLVEVTVRW